jgi:putative addiction module component (TIGR02574 family)
MSAESAVLSTTISVNDAPAVRQAALNLSPRERSALAHELWDSLEGIADTEFDSDEPLQLSEEWIREIERRMEEVRSGKAVLIDGEEVFAKLRQRTAT